MDKEAKVRWVIKRYLCDRCDGQEGRDWSLVTPGTSSIGSLLALTVSGAGAGLGDPRPAYQKLDPDNLEHYRKAFHEFDLDGDGKISTQVRLSTVLTGITFGMIFCDHYFYLRSSITPSDECKRILFASISDHRKNTMNILEA